MVSINISETASPVTSRIRRAYRESTGGGGGGFDVLKGIGANSDTLILASIVGIGLAAGYYATHYVNTNKPFDSIVANVLAPSTPGTTTPSTSTTPTNIPPAVISNAAYAYNTQMADFEDEAVVYNTNLAEVDDAEAGAVIVDENTLTDNEVRGLEEAALLDTDSNLSYAAYSEQQLPEDYYHYQVVRDSDDTLIGIASA